MSSINVVTGYTEPDTGEFVEHGPPGVEEGNGASTIYPNVVTGYTDPVTGEFIEHGPNDILDVVIGTVTEGPVAEVTNTGTGSEPVLNFVLPRGPAFKIKGVKETEEDLPTTGVDGDNWLVEENGELYSWSIETNSWESVGKIVGPQGNAATIGIGNVVEGPVATVVNVGTVHNAILNFTIPMGNNTPTINSGVTTGGLMPITTFFYTEIVTAPEIIRQLPVPSLGNKGYSVTVHNASESTITVNAGSTNWTIFNGNTSRFQSDGVTWYRF